MRWLRLVLLLPAFGASFGAPAAAKTPATPALTASDWTQFQGSSAHLGAAESSTLAPPLRPLWTFHEPNGTAGLSGPVIVGGTVIAVGSHGVYGLDATSGATLWTIARTPRSPIVMPAVGQAGRREILVYTDGTRDSGSSIVGVDLADRRQLWRQPLRAISRTGVTIDGGLVLVGDREAHLYAFDLATGKPTSWSPVSLGGGAIEAPPASAGGQAYVVTENDTTGAVRVVAVKESNGAQTWDYTPRLSAGTGSVVTVEGGRAMFGMGGEQQVHALTQDTGVAVWASRTRSSFSPLASPASAAGSLYVTSTSGSVAALYAFDAASGTKRWDFQFEESSLLSSPVVVGGTVYLGLDDGVVAGIDTRRGVEVWEAGTGSGNVGPLAASGDLLVVSKRGRNGGLVAFGPNPGGRLLDIQSPSKLRFARVLIEYAVGLALVFTFFFVIGRVGRRLLGPPMTAKERAGGQTTGGETTAGETTGEGTGKGPQGLPSSEGDQ